MENNKYDISLVRKYLKGELDAPGMYQLERQAQNDPLLADLIQGMEAGEENTHIRNIAEINDLIDQRTSSQRAYQIPLLRYGIAASVLLASALVALFVFREPEQVALSGKKSQKMPELNAASSVADTVRKVQSGSEPAEVKEKRLHQSDQIVKNKRKGKVSRKKTTLPPGPKTDSIHLSEVLITGYSTQAKRAIVVRPTLDIQDTGFTSDTAADLLATATPSEGNRAASKAPGLNEVAVRGYGSPAKTSTLIEKGEKPLPAEGWQKYQDYLKEKTLVGKGQGGTVVLLFKVSKNGALSGFKVFSSSNDSLNEKAVALVKNGPAWQASADNKNAIVEIRFREREE